MRTRGDVAPSEKRPEHPEPSIGPDAVSALERGAGGTTERQPEFLLRIWGVVATVASVLILFLLLIPAAIVTRFNSHLVTPLQKLLSRLIFTICGIKVEVRGVENLAGIGQYVAVSNHQSLLDILALILHAPGEMRFVAKREIQKVPLVGFVLYHSENIVIDRKAGGKAIRRAIEVVRHGYSISVFAEGHRHDDGQVHEFNDGAAWLAALTKLPCVPLAISGTAAMMPRGSLFVVPGRRMRLTFGPPIPAADVHAASRAELTRRLEGAVRNLLSG